MATLSASIPLSERSKMVAPSLIDLEAFWHNSSKACSMPAAPPEVGKRVGSVAVFKSFLSRCRIFSISLPVRIGCSIFSFRQCSGDSSRRFNSFPNVTSIDMTSSSRIESIAGLVT